VISVQKSESAQKAHGSGICRTMHFAGTSLFGIQYKTVSAIYVRKFTRGG